MKTFKRNRKSLAVIDGAWCVVLALAILLIIFVLDWGAERVLPLIIGQLCILAVFSRSFASNYGKVAKVSAKAVDFDNVKEKMYAYHAPFAEVDRLVYGKSRLYGNPALIIKLKNRKKIEIDTHYYDCAAFWQTVCDSVKAASPGARIDEGIYKKIEKMKKQ